MLQLSSQVTQNLTALMGRFSSRGISASYNNWQLCIVLVSNNLAVPTTHTGAINYINSALNGTSFYGGTPGNEVNCMGIIDTIPSASYATTTCMAYDGIAQYTAKQTGTIGGAIITLLYSTSTTAPSVTFPLTSATSQTNANTFTGYSVSGTNKIYNYSIITDSVGTSGDSMVILDSTSVVSGQTYNFYGSSMKFSSQG